MPSCDWHLAWGDFDECLAVRAELENLNGETENFKGKYCATTLIPISLISGADSEDAIVEESKDDIDTLDIVRTIACCSIQTTLYINHSRIYGLNTLSVSCICL